MKSKKLQSGFSLVEVLLSSVLLGIIAASIATFFSAGAESFSLIKARNEALEKARYGMNRISKEIMYLASSDFITLNPTSLEFNDSGNIQTTYELGTYSGNTAVVRGADVLIPNAQSINFDYYDANGVATSTPADVRTIQVTLVIDAEDNQGSVTLQTTIFPREFIYTGFQ